MRSFPPVEHFYSSDVNYAQSHEEEKQSHRTQLFLSFLLPDRAKIKRIGRNISINQVRNMNPLDFEGMILKVCVQIQIIMLKIKVPVENTKYKPVQNTTSMELKRSQSQSPNSHLPCKAHAMDSHIVQ